ncbi:MAG: helix-turn-helix domain-containing protein, partial [Bosea sp. (in: a-proteobacteria)]
MRDFPTSLRQWRRTRRLSQLALANEAEVSPRHLAFLETGRSRPSRSMVLRLAEVLALPHEDQNGFLAAAGFAPQFPALPLAAEEMAQVRAAMGWTIDRHAPYPALILDMLWRVVALNRPAARLFGPAGFAEGTSLLDAMGNLPVLQGLIANWVEVSHHTVMRLRAESARGGGIAGLDRAVAALLAHPGVADCQPEAMGRAVLPTLYRVEGRQLALISTYAQFGAA